MSLGVTVFSTQHENPYQCSDDIQNLYDDPGNPLVSFDPLEITAYQLIVFDIIFFHNNLVVIFIKVPFHILIRNTENLKTNF